MDEENEEWMRRRENDEEKIERMKRRENG